MIFDDTITIFNHYDDNGVDRWKKTILDKTMWKSDLVKSISDGVINVATLHKVTILMRNNYVSPKKFAELKNKANVWTLNTENNLDIIVYGAIDKDVDDTTYTISDLLNDFDEVGTISAVRDNTNMPHLKNWKVTLK